MEEGLLAKKLRYVPITSFAIILGLGILTIMLDYTQSDVILYPSEQ